MNIFVLHKDTKICAMYHCDKHVVKMIVEYAQMLCTTYHVVDEKKVASFTSVKFFKKTHHNHPCTQWVRKSKENFKWLLSLGIALCEQYTLRYKKIHSVEPLFYAIKNNPPDLPDGELSVLPQAMPEEYRRETPIEGYREYYVKDKKRFAKWYRQVLPAMPWVLIKD